MGIQLPSVSPHPLWQASLWVADDLLIMQKLKDNTALQQPVYAALVIGICLKR